MSVCSCGIILRASVFLGPRSEEEEEKGEDEEGEEEGEGEDEEGEERPGVKLQHTLEVLGGASPRLRRAFMYLGVRRRRGDEEERRRGGQERRRGE